MKKLIKIKLVLISLGLLAAAFIFPYRLLISNIAKRNAKVVLITRDFGGGTGFHLKAPSGKYYIITNRHVCDAAGRQKYLKVSYNDKQIWSRILKKSRSVDLCAMEPMFNAGLDLKNIANPIKYFPHFAVGHGALSPVHSKFGFYIGSVYVTMCMERKEYNCTAVAENYLNGYSFNIIGGHSGSPIFNAFGQLVGVANAGNEAHSFGVPLQDLLKFVEDL